MVVFEILDRNFRIEREGSHVDNRSLRSRHRLYLFSQVSLTKTGARGFSCTWLSTEPQGFLFCLCGAGITNTTGSFFFFFFLNIGAQDWAWVLMLVWQALC